MKIARAFFNILLFCVVGLLAINFVRMTLNEGVEGYFITFRDVMQLIADFHYNIDRAVDLVLISINDELALVGKVGEGLSELWSGDNILEKIFSLFTVIFDYFKLFIKFFVDSLKLIFRIVGVLFTFVKAIVKLLGDLAGKVIAPFVITS